MLHYQYTKGLGKPYTFLHGLGEDHSIFNRQTHYLQEYSLPTLSVDLEGHGQSLLKNGKTSIPQQAESLDQVLTSEKIEETNLIGFSLGAAVALEYVHQHPEKVNKLCLINPAFYHDHFLTWQVKLVRNVLEHFKESALKDNHPRKKPADLSKASLSNAYFSFLNGFRTTPAAGLHANICALIEYGTPSYLHEIKTETLIVRGENDELLRETLVKHLDTELPNSNLVTLPGNHVLMLDKREEVNRLLMGFFG